MFSIYSPLEENLPFWAFRPKFKILRAVSPSRQGIHYLTHNSIGGTAQKSMFPNIYLMNGEVLGLSEKTDMGLYSTVLIVACCLVVCLSDKLTICISG